MEIYRKYWQNSFVYSKEEMFVQPLNAYQSVFLTRRAAHNILSDEIMLQNTIKCDLLVKKNPVFERAHTHTQIYKKRAIKNAYQHVNGGFL